MAHPYYTASVNIPTAPDTPVPPKPADAYRLLHTADWHLGKMLNDRSREEEHRRFLHWLLETVQVTGADAIVLAGDVFDTANPSNSALQLYYDFLARLFRSRRCVLLAIAGNHDSAAQLEAPRDALNALNVHVTGFLPESPEDRLCFLPSAENPRVAVAMLPFLRDRDLRTGRAGETREDIRARLLEGIRERYSETAAALARPPTDPCPAIATGHLTVLGGITSESERDIHIGGLGQVPPDVFPEIFSYVALGHLHRPQAVDPAGRVRYSGSPIPLSFSEVNDTKEIRIIDVTGNTLRQASLPVPRFRKLLRVRSSATDLERNLKNSVEMIKEAPLDDLQPWLEVTVTEASPVDDLNQRVHDCVDGSTIDVVRVLRDRPEVTGGIELAGTSDDQAIDALIDHPRRVFELLLDRDTSLDVETRESLSVAFAELLEMEARSELIR